MPSMPLALADASQEQLLHLPTSWPLNNLRSRVCDPPSPPSPPFSHYRHNTPYLWCSLPTSPQRHQATNPSSTPLPHCRGRACSSSSTAVAIHHGEKLVVENFVLRQYKYILVGAAGQAEHGLELSRHGGRRVLLL